MNFEISFDFIVFETERLLLREFNADDVDAVYAYAGDAENTIYMDWGPANREEVSEFCSIPPCTADNGTAAHF